MVEATVEAMVGAVAAEAVATEPLNPPAKAVRPGRPIRYQ